MIEKEIKNLRRFGRELKRVTFKTVDNRIIISARIINCPDQEAAKAIAELLNGVLAAQEAKIFDLLEHLEEGVQQLNIFTQTKGNENEIARSGSIEEGRASDSNSEPEGGGEHTGGLLRHSGSGDQHVQHGAVDRIKGFFKFRWFKG